MQVSILSVEIGTGGRDPGYDMDIVWMLELPLPPWTFLLVVASCNYSFLLFDTAFAKSFTANFLQKVTLLRGSYRRGSGVSGALVFLVEDLQTPPPSLCFRHVMPPRSAGVRLLKVSKGLSTAKIHAIRAGPERRGLYLGIRALA